MRSNLLCAGLMALCSTFAHATATPTQWSFTYTGFFNEENAVFLPDWTLSGTFSGTDRDADGVLVAGELTSLVVDELDYIQCSSTEFMTCGTTAFSFKLPGAAGVGDAHMSTLAAAPALSFELGFDARDPEWFVGAGRSIKTGLSDYSFRRDPGGFEQATYSWRSDTLLAITPVPEPGSWALLGLGLAALVFGGRRKNAGPRQGATRSDIIG